MSENPSLDSPPEADAKQYKRQTVGKTVALLRRERIIVANRLVEIDKEIENLLKNE
jgi:hypothetical protein